MFQGFASNPPYSPSDWRPIRIAGAIDVLVKGANDRGQIVGGFSTGSLSSKVWHGFVADPIPWCQPDLGSGTPNGPRLTVCGRPLATGNQADLSLTRATPNSSALLLASPARGKLPFASGSLIPAGPNATALLMSTSSTGTIAVPGIPGGGSFDVYVQFICLDPLRAGGLSLSNALRVEFLR